MTMPHERLRAIRSAGELMRLLAGSHESKEDRLGGVVPEKLRLKAHHILRHFPDDGDLLHAAKHDIPIRGWLALGPWRQPDKSLEGLEGSERGIP
jgi:hypothetical protein